MFKNIENIRIQYANISKTTQKREVRKRPSNLLSFRIAGEGYFDFGDKVINAQKGKIAFLPAGSSYDFIPTTKERESMRIAFYADIEDAWPRSYSMEGFADMHKFLYEVPKWWRKGDEASIHKCYAVLHSLLAFLMEQDQKSYENKTKYKIIKPAMEYLDEHIFDADPDIEKMCFLCGISLPYFRRIFKANFGVSPGKYIEEKKLDYAKSIIENGDFDTICEVAERVGYNDPLYFSKVFKKRFGASPTHIK